MNRDMEVVRGILLQVRDADHMNGVRAELEGVDQEVIRYHNILLHEAGLVEGFDAGNISTGPNVVPTRLTWDGHEFIDNASNNEVWEKTKRAAGGASFSIFTSLMAEIMKKTVGID